MTPEQFTATRVVADAIDTLQEHHALGDEESDRVFCSYLEEIGSNIEAYWDMYEEKIGPIYRSHLC